VENPRRARALLVFAFMNRLLSLFAPASLVAVIACSSSVGVGPSSQCECPATGVWPLVAVELPCGSQSFPVIHLTGVCAGTNGLQDGQLVFGSMQGGTCGVSIAFPDGTTFSSTVEFEAESLPCGSNPQGCGVQVHPVGLSRSPTSVLAQLPMGPQCGDADAGVTVRDASAD
jgi:hypothetical protein